MARKDLKDFISSFSKSDKSKNSDKKEDLLERLRGIAKISDEHELVGGVLVKRGDSVEDVKMRLVEEISRTKARARKEGLDLDEVMVQDSDGNTMSILDFERDMENQIKKMLKSFGKSSDKTESKKPSKFNSNNTKSILRVPSETLKQFDENATELYEQIYQALVESVAGFYDGQPKLEPIQKAMRLSLITMAHIKNAGTTKGFDEDKVEALADCMRMFVDIDLDTHLIFVSPKKNLERDIVGYSVMGVPRENTVKHIKKMIEEADSSAHREAAQKALNFFENNGNRVLN